MKITYETGEKKADAVVALSYAISCLKSDAESWEKIAETHDIDDRPDIRDIELNFVADDNEYIRILTEILDNI